MFNVGDKIVYPMHGAGTIDSIEEKNILEEVIYTISLSVCDNYEVKGVVFNVENEEIYKTVLKTIE